MSNNTKQKVGRPGRGRPGSQSAASPIPNNKKASMSQATNNLKSVSCGKCKNEILELEDIKDPNDESIQCDTCNMWFHRQCSELINSEFDFLNKCDKSILWKCKDCLTRHGQGKQKAVCH